MEVQTARNHPQSSLSPTGATGALLGGDRALGHGPTWARIPSFDWQDFSRIAGYGLSNPLPPGDARELASNPNPSSLIQVCQGNKMCHWLRNRQ